MNAPVSQAILEDLKRDEQAPTIQDYLRIVSRHRYTIIVLTLIFALLGLVRSAMEVPLYRATTTLLIEPRGTKFVDTRDLNGQQVSNFEYFQTQFEILRTRPLISRTVEIVGPEKIVASFAVDAPFSWNKLVGSEPDAVIDEKATIERAIGLVGGKLDITPVRSTQLVLVSFDTPTASMSAELADALAKAYIENTLEARLEMSQAAATWLSGRLGGLREQVTAAEDKLQAFRAENNIVGSTDGGGLPAQSVSMLTTRLAEAQAERLGKDAGAREIAAARRNNAPMEDVAAVQRDALVQSLRSQVIDLEKERSELSAKYLPKHPSIIKNEAATASAKAALKKQAGNVAEAILREYQVAQQVEQEVRNQLGGAKGELRDLTSNSLEASRLERDLEAARALYEKFKNQLTETSETSSMETSNARVVNAARAGNVPVFPNTRRTVMAALVLGLMLSVALAFLLDHLDNTVKTAETVERLVQLPVLGLVPTIKTKGRKDPLALRHYTDNPKTQFAEALRTLRTGVLLSGLDKSHRRLLITSSVPSEGKTTVALNLAQALSQMHKVLLIDGDMRRPSVAAVLGDQAPSKGLSQFIAGEAKISDCVHQLDGTNAYLMTAGVIPPNPLELISSQKFSDALANLSKVFDYIVIDAPPSLAVSDALVLSRLVDGVLYVVRSDSSPQAAVQAGIKRLRRVDAPLIGVILNRVGERSHGYGYGRYSYYAEGYDQQHYGYYGQGGEKPRRRWFS